MSTKQIEREIKRLTEEYERTGEIALYRQMCSLAILRLSRISPAVHPILSAKVPSVGLLVAFRDAIDHFLALYGSHGDVQAAVKALIVKMSNEKQRIMEILHERVSHGVRLDPGSRVELLFWDRRTPIEGDAIYSRRLHAIQALC
jgi:hypothetical protein